MSSCTSSRWRDGQPRPENRGSFNLTQEGAPDERDQHCQSAASAYDRRHGRASSSTRTRSAATSIAASGSPPGSNARPIRRRPPTRGSIPKCGPQVLRYGGSVSREGGRRGGGDRADRASEAGAGARLAGKALDRGAAVPEHERRSRAGLFADGIVEDVVTGLSHIKWLFVIARNSSAVYK